MAPSMARLTLILSIFSSLFLVSLARIPADLTTEQETQIEILIPEESNTTVLTLRPNESTDLERFDPTKKVEEENNDTQVSNLALPDESREREVVVESNPGMISGKVMGWDPRVDEQDKKEEKVVRKKKSKRSDESDSDSDSDSDDEDQEEEKEGKKKRKKKGKKGGFLRRFLKWINIFD